MAADYLRAQSLADVCASLKEEKQCLWRKYLLCATSKSVCSNTACAKICSVSNINFSRQRGSRSHGCLAASVRHHPVLPPGRLCRGNDVHVSSTEGDVAVEEDLKELHERQQAQRRKLKTLRRRCIRIHRRLQEFEDAYSSDTSPGNWYCGPSLSTQGSGTEDEEVNDEVGAPHTCRN